MKFSTAIVLSSAASLVAAAPMAGTKAKRDNIDTTILNYALTLEYLENRFYHDALAKYDNNAFTSAGLPSWARGRFEQIASHEAAHVSQLAGALGSQATKECTYSFPYTDPASFAALSSIIEGVGVSAYLGAASLITNKQYVTVAGSILTTESRHQGWVESAVEHAQPWSGPNDTPLGFSQVYSLVVPFITSCPSTNPKLPVTAFPKATASPANAAAGTSVTYTFTSNSTQPLYAAYFSGLNVKTVPLNGGKTATIPSGIQGTYYTVITSSANGTVTDANTIAGPIISVANFDSNASN